MDRAIDERGAVIHRFCDDALRKALVDRLQTFGNPLRDVAAILTDKHEHRAKHDFTGVFGRRARSQFLAQQDVGYIADSNRQPMSFSYDDAAHVIE